MKRVLTGMIVLSWMAGIIAIAAACLQTGAIRWDLVCGSLAIVILSALCSRYLFITAKKHKAEWALFGFLGNLNALLIFWLMQNIESKWRQGRPFFG